MNGSRAHRLVAIGTLVLIGCSSGSSGHGSPGGGEGPLPGGGGGGGGSGSGSGSGGGGGGTLGLGDPSANRQILTSRDEDLVIVDLATRTNTPIFSFNRFDNVSSSVLVGRTLYVGAGDNSINAIDFTTDNLLWDAPFGRYESTALADPIIAVRDDTAYGSGVPGVMTAFDITNGNVRWQYPLDPAGATDSYFSGASAPEVTADRVFVGTSTIFAPNYIHAIDRATGARVWRQPIPRDSGLSGAPRLVGDTLLVPAGDLLALDAATGAVKWTLPMYGRGAGTPVFAGDRLLVQGAADVADGRLYCVELATGRVVWTLPAGNDYAGVYLPTVIRSARGLLVAGVKERGSGESTTGNGEPFLAEVADGTVIWDNADVAVETSPVFANDQMFFHGQNFRGSGSIDNNVGLIVLDASTGAFQEVDTYFQYREALTPLVLADNGTFGTGADGN